MSKPLSAALAMALAASSLAMTGTAYAKANEVKFGDLDLDTAAGRATLDGRIRNAARSLCETEQTTGTRIKSDCHKQVRDQVLAQVGDYLNRVGKGG